MKAELKAKFLQHLNQKNQDKGFTLIELLVVIIIIGILSAIALPSYLNQVTKAKQSEAKNYVGVVNRTQLVYYADNARFASSVTALSAGLPTRTTNYDYEITNDSTSATFEATTLQPELLKSYAGGVVALPSGLTPTAACQTEGASNVAPIVLYTSDGAACASINQIMK